MRLSPFLNSAKTFGGGPKQDRDTCSLAAASESVLRVFLRIGWDRRGPLQTGPATKLAPVSVARVFLK